jgi:hypothetical protein
VLEGGWSAPESDALKIIFLVGDAPPHMDYAGDVHYPATLQDALKQNIMVNTVQCGNYGPCRTHWQKIARLGEGKYVAIDQSGGMAAVSTPHDKALAELERKITASRLFYGTAAEMRDAEKKSKEEADARAGAMAMGAEAAADRAALKCRRGLVAGRRDLVRDVMEKKVDLAKIDPAELPESLRGKKTEEILALLKARWAERKALDDEMKDLVAKRDACIKTEMAKREKAGGFDAKVKDIIRERAKKAGIELD